MHIKQKPWTVDHVHPIHRLRLLHVITDSTTIYAVEYPQKIGGQDSTRLIQDQFLKADEAEQLYNRLAAYFTTNQ